jgi:SSS family solute:Na+ symporter
MFVLIGGAIAVTVIGLNTLGGWTVMTETVPAGFMSVWKPISDPSFPWTGILLGAPILGVWYWCTDQFIVQRVLSAHNIDNARRGTIFGAYLKILPLFIFVLPGVIAYGLAEQQVLELGEPDEALPTLIGVLLPTGLKGLVVAGMLAALMSSLSSVFNSCSTLITWDVYKQLNPGASDRTLVWVGQISTVVLVVLGLLWIPMMDLISGQIYQYLQSVQAYISPPIAAVFLLGIFWQRLNAAGAIASLAVGFVLGIGRLLAELNKDSLGGFLYWYADINFLHFAIFLFVVCASVLIAVSFATPAPAPEKLRGLTFATTAGGETAQATAHGVQEHLPTLHSDPAWRLTDKVLTVGAILCVAAIWLYFTG